MTRRFSRRDALRTAAMAAAALALPYPLRGCAREDPPRDVPLPDDLPGITEDPPTAEDGRRLVAWIAALRDQGFGDERLPLGRSAARVGELARGTPYEAFTLEEYIRAGGSPARTEPLTLSLTRFDCVSLIEACLAIARMAATEEPPSWTRFGQEMERMRYRGGQRGGYASRLHYFSEWMSDGARRGLLRDLGNELGAVEDSRPLRFMTENPESYPALADAGVLAAIAAMERGLDRQPRRVIPTARIPEVDPRLETGDVLAFATSIPGLDVSHAAFAYRDENGVLRVLHAPLTGGVVEITRATLPQYVAAIQRSTGIIVARPLR